MRIATWNINGIKARIETLVEWLKAQSPDILALQEIKSVDEAFPHAAFEGLGYHIATHGQKGFNGVALLSKLPFLEVIRGLPGDESDEQARYIEGVFSRPSGVLRIGGAYMPNGNPIETEKFPYKLNWLRRMETHLAKRLSLEEPFALIGDYNIIPMPEDCFDPQAWEGDALYQPETRASYRRMLGLGLVDAVRATTDAAKTYTFWDYQAGAWQRNHGIRIDHALLSPQAADQLTAVHIDKDVRGQDKPSDHVPVIIELSL